MKGFDAKFIEELKNKNDIVDTVGRYVHLEQRGGNFWGRCPFHHEKTASFSVNSTDQFYYCFGCHKSGDVISFIMEIESLDFNDAVRYLAEKANVPLPEIKYDDEKVKEQKEKRQRLISCMRETALFYVKTLRSGSGAKHLEYALGRKLTPDTILKFGMGASPDFNSLPAHLKSKGYTNEEIVSSGACGEKDGRCFDWMGKRLVIPLVDQFGNVISFAGRRIDGIKEQKYINTKESSIFSKGKTFFNINNLKKLKNEKGLDSVIIVEGHLDVVSLVQAGIENVVASMGTALTKDQARILKRYTDKVFISYDGDASGQKATIRGLEILSEEGIEVKVVSMPEGLDPDDVIKTHGVEGYKLLLSEAKLLIDFKIEVLKRSLDLKTVDGKRKFVSGAVKIIKESPSPAEQEDLLKTVRNLTGVTLEALKRELYASPESQQVEAKTETPMFTDNTGDRSTLASRFVLSAYLFGKPYAMETDINGIEFGLPVHKEIKDYILQKIKLGEKPRFSDLYELVSDEDKDELSRIAGMEAEENKKVDQTTYFSDCVRTIKLDKINSEIEKLNGLFKSETDTEKRREIAKELSQKLAQKNKLTK
ncbi:MAG: DNA primase [Clostridiales bacterium]|nr:DNA primase [Clostridiales bacterium]